MDREMSIATSGSRRAAITVSRRWGRTVSGFLLVAIALLTSARSSRAAFVPAGGSCTTFTCASWPWGSAEGIATSPDGVFVYTMVGLRIYVRDGARQVTTWRTAAAAGDAGSSG